MAKKQYTAHDMRQVIDELQELKDTVVKLKWDSKKLNDKISTLRDVIATKDTEIAKRNALIKELADMLTNYMNDEWCGCATSSELEEANNHQEKYRELIANALKEVSND